MLHNAAKLSRKFNVKTKKLLGFAALLKALEIIKKKKMDFIPILPKKVLKFDCCINLERSVFAFYKLAFLPSLHLFLNTFYNFEAKPHQPISVSEKMTF